MPSLSGVVVHAGTLQLAQQHRPFLAGFEKPAGSVHAKSHINGILLGRRRDFLQFRAAGHCVDLVTAGGLNAIEIDKGLADRLANREQPVIA